MMRKEVYKQRIKTLTIMKKGASPEQQEELSYTIMGMKWAHGDAPNEKLHDERMALLKSNNPSDLKNGVAYKKGIDAVWYGTRGKKTETGTVMLSNLRVHKDVERGLDNIRKYLKIKTLAPVRKIALQWYIDMMCEKCSRNFYK